MLSFYKTKTAWFLEHVLFAGIPICYAVLEFGRQPFWHYLIMALVVVYMYLIARFFQAKNTELGFSFSKLSSHVRQILPGTIAIGAIIILGKFAGLIQNVPQSHYLLIYILVSVPLQELVFRSFCVWRCSLSWSSTMFITIFVSLNFAFYHFIFNDWQLVAGVFIINLYWSYWYFRQKDILATIISHALIGIAYFM